MIKKYISNLSLCLASVAFLSGCGSDSKSTNTTNYNIEDEPYFKYQWYFNSKNSELNTKGFTIDDNADINITKAWETTKGAGVIVAVIDDGAETSHEDLASNIYKAYDTDKGTSNINKTYVDIEDTSHGNTCAGFVAAPVNGKGLVGTAPEAKLLIIKQTDGDDANIIKGLEYAKNSGAKVVSCSWGTYSLSQAVDNQLKSLYDAGITVLFASGNDYKDLDDVNNSDESESQWVIGVGASGENNDVTWYSNYGSQLDVIAPGGNLFSSAGVLGLDNTGSQGSTTQHSLVTNNYAFTHGTSFSCPITAGVVALMYSIKPDITPQKVREILISTADKVGVTATYDVNGFDNSKLRGYGKVNAGKAIEEVKKLVN